MTVNKLLSPAEEPEQPIKAAELSDEEIANLTGYFDVLIQMDLFQKESKENSDDNKRNTNYTS